MEVPKSQNNLLQASYLTGLNPGVDDGSKKLKGGTLETVAIRTKMLKRLETVNFD